MRKQRMNKKLCINDEKAKPHKLAIVKRLNFFLTSTSWQLTYQSLDNFNDQEHYLSTLYKKNISLIKISRDHFFLFFVGQKEAGGAISKAIDLNLNIDRTESKRTFPFSPAGQRLYQ